MKSMSTKLILITSYFEFEIITRLLNQFNDIIIIWPPNNVFNYNIKIIH